MSDTETQEYMEAENIYRAKSLFQKIKAESSDKTSSQQFGRIWTIIMPFGSISLCNTFQTFPLCDQAAVMCHVVLAHFISTN